MGVRKLIRTIETPSEGVAGGGTAGSGIASINGLDGDVTIAGAGSNTVTQAGSTITVSGSSAAANIDGLATSGYVEATSGVLDGRLESTGQNLQGQIDSLDAETGNYLQIVDLNGLATSGYVETTSGVLDTRLQQTGQDLLTEISNSVPQNIVFTTGNQSINGQKTFLGQSFFNNITVTGTQTILNTEEVTVSNNYLNLNATGGAIDAGIYIETGNGIGAIIGYDVPAQKWVFGTGVSGQNQLDVLGVIASENFVGLEINAASGVLSTRLVTTGQDLQNQIDSLAAETGNYLQSANLNGLATSGYVEATSGVLDTRLVSTGQALQTQIDGLAAETGNYYTNDNPSGFVTDSELLSTSGDLVDQITAAAEGVASVNGLSGVITVSGAGNVTTSEDGQNIIVSGADQDLSSFATTGQLNAASGLLESNIELTGSGLQVEVDELKAETGNYLQAADLNGLATSGYVESTSGVLDTRLETTGQDLLTEIANSVPQNVVFTTGNQVVNGQKTFLGQSFFNNITVTGTQTILNTEEVTVANNYLNLNATGGAIDAGIYIETGNGLGAIIGYDLPAQNWVAGTGASGQVDLSTLPVIASQTFVDTQINSASGVLSTRLENTGSNLQSQIDDLSTETGNYLQPANLNGLATSGYVESTSGVLANDTLLTGSGLQVQVDAINAGTGNFITGDLSLYATTVSLETASGLLEANIELTGSGLQVQIDSLSAETGNYYTNDNPSGFTTESFVTGASGVLQTQIDNISVTGGGGGVGSADTLVEIINQTSHGLTTGDVVRYDSADGWVKALASDGTKQEALGIVQSGDANNFEIVLGGKVVADSFFTTGVNYLSETTSGALITSAPTGIQKTMVYAINDSTGYVLNYVGVTVSSESGIDNSYNVAEQIDQVAHGLSAGDVVRYDQSDGWVKAIADSASKAEVLGVVQSATTDAFDLILQGRVNIDSFFTTGVNYLSETTSGALITTAPTGIQKTVLNAIDTSTAYVLNYVGFEIQSEVGFTNLYNLQNVGTGNDAIYVNPTGKDTVINHILIHNYDSGFQGVTLYNVPNGDSVTGDNQFFDVSLSGYETVELDLQDGILLKDNDDTLYATADATGAVNLTINGKVYDDGEAPIDRLREIALLASSGTPQLINDARIQHVIVHNTNTADEVVRFHLTSGTSASDVDISNEIFRTTLEASDTAFFTFQSLVVNNGWAFQASSDTADQVTIQVYGD